MNKLEKLKSKLDFYDGGKVVFSWLLLIVFLAFYVVIRNIYGIKKYYQKGTVKVYEIGIDVRSGYKKGSTVTLSFIGNNPNDSSDTSQYKIYYERLKLETYKDAEAYLIEKDSIISVWFSSKSKKGLVQLNQNEDKKDIILYEIQRGCVFLIAGIPWLYFFIRSKITKKKINALQKN
ncbi:MAG: hypothetical protein AAF806_22855 [Bacteroidota bacterium]